MTSARRRTLGSVAPLAAAAIAIGFSARHASAEDPDQTARTERCAIRLSIAVTGKGPNEALLTVPNPQTKTDELLTTPEFREKFARFVNATFNRTPGMNSGEDAPYHLALRVLQTARPWRDMFVGPYAFAEDGDGNVTVKDAADGLGYFRSNKWLLRYAGNEQDGLKISTAYRMMHNTIGLKLSATTNVPNADISATGRAKQPCASCHQENWYALDKVSQVLTRRSVSDMGRDFDPPKGGPQTVLGGITVKDDKELVTALVDSDAFRFRQCRIAFNYLYGRDENRCEGPIFDKCMAAFTEKGTIQSAISAIATDPSFCQ